MGYPVTSYPINAYKIWTFAAPVNHSIQVTVVHFDVGYFSLKLYFSNNSQNLALSTQTDMFDRLELYDSYQLDCDSEQAVEETAWMVLSGSLDAGMSVATPSNWLTIVFESDLFGSSDGFELEVEAITREEAAVVEDLGTGEIFKLKYG